MSAGAFTKHKLCPIKNSKSTSWCSCEDVSCCVCGDTNFIGVPPAVLLNIRLIGSWIRQEFAQIQHLAGAYRNIYSQIRSVYAGGICRGFKMITLKFGQFWIFVLHWALFHKTGRIYTRPIWGRTIWPQLQNPKSTVYMKFWVEVIMYDLFEVVYYDLIYGTGLSSYKIITILAMQNQSNWKKGSSFVSQETFFIDYSLGATQFSIGKWYSFGPLMALTVLISNSLGLL